MPHTDIPDEPQQGGLEEARSAAQPSHNQADNLSEASVYYCNYPSHQGTFDDPTPQVVKAAQFDLLRWVANEVYAAWLLAEHDTQVNARAERSAILNMVRAKAKELGYKGNDLVSKDGAA